jgi:hypothetical protein
VKGIQRPKMFVLPETAHVPSENLVEPPTRFTHALTADQPCYYSRGQSKPAGTLTAGTRVALISSDETECQVVDPRGLSLFTACAGLEPYRAPDEKTRPSTRRGARKGTKRR